MVTRSDLVDDVRAIEERLRGKNDSAPIFRSTMRIADLIALEEFHAKEQRTQRGTPDLKGSRVGAFCALGNPEAFFKTIERYLGDEAQLVFKKAFADHHSYSQADIDEIGRLAREAGAELLITTAKDAVKLKSLSFEMPCFVAESETMIEDGEAFRRLIED